MREGDYVAVVGTVAGPGYLYADQVGRFDTEYVAGASEVFVAGIPSSINTGEGKAMVGDLSVDYTQALSRGTHPGASISFFRGVRPTSSGTMLSNTIER